MKRILLSSLTGLLILASCSKDGGSSGASIVGSWDINNVYSKYYVNNELQESDTTTEGNFQFESNGNLIITDEDGDTTQGIYNYSASNGNLSFISDGDTTNAHVTNLTQDNLHFTADESGDYVGITYRVTLDADFKKH